MGGRLTGYVLLTKSTAYTITVGAGGASAGGGQGNNGTNSSIGSLVIATGGGGGGQAINGTGWAGNGANGAVRIVWPGTTRQFPTTCVGAP